MAYNFQCIQGLSKKAIGLFGIKTKTGTNCPA